MRNMGFPGSSEVKNLPVTQETACNAGDVGLTPRPGRFPERKRQPNPVFLPGKSHGQRNLVATVHGVQESDVT